MAIKALSIDLYGTLVRDNDALMRDICSRISGMSRIITNPSIIGRAWWQLSTDYTNKYCGDDFKNTHELEEMALENLMTDFDAHLDPRLIVDEIFTMMRRPSAYDDARVLLARFPMTYTVICNGDRDDIETALEYSGLGIDDFLCSEDATYYKPDIKIFEAMVEKLNLKPDEILHVGDSIAHDIIPAKSIGMKTAYLNRFSRPIPEDFDCDFMCKSLTDLRGIIK